MKRVMASIVLAAALVLAGCGKSAGGPGGGGAEADAKLNAYVGAYNAVVDGGVSIPDSYQKYLDEDIAHASAKDQLSVSSSMLGYALPQLKRARELPGDGGELDAAGDELTANLNKLILRLDGLNGYYASRKYTEDGLARGRQEDPLVKADYEAAIKASERLGAALDAIQTTKTAQHIAELKAKGDMLGYDEVAAIEKTRDLVRLFKSEADLKDPAKLKQGDALVAELEALLADERLQLADPSIKRTDSNTDRVANFSGSVAKMELVIGSFRKIKEEASVNEASYMVSEFNDAVGYMNAVNN